MKFYLLILLALSALIGSNPLNMIMQGAQIVEKPEPPQAHRAADLSLNQGDPMNNHIPFAQSESEPKQTEDETRRPGQPLFTFSGTEPAWYTVNDSVMGGISQSSVRIDPANRQLSFSGEVSLENNGGFASIRTDWLRYDLSNYDGILMRVLGDGSTYRFRIRTALTGPEIAYTALFQTKDGQWHDVYIPFAEMVPTYRGRIVTSAPALEPASIRSFGLMVSDKQEGQFSLTVDWINAVRVKRGEFSYASHSGELGQAPSLVFSNENSTSTGRA